MKGSDEEEEKMGRGDVVEVVWHSRFLHLPQVHSTPALCHRGAGYDP
jgi:hypothetical protein